jgi:hypothetical protein
MSLPNPKGKPKGAGCSKKKKRALVPFVLLMALLVCGAVIAQERPPFEIVGSGVCGFSDLGHSLKDAGGGFQLGTRTRLDEGLALQTLATKVSLGNSEQIRKVSAELMQTFWITKGSWLYLLFAADNNLGGTNASPSTDLALGLGGILRLKTFTGTQWLRAPTLDMFVQIKVVDGDKPTTENPLSSGTYTELTAGLSFAPGELIRKL